MGSKIVVVGSCMVDFTSYTPQLPKDGETIHGTKFSTAFGGKGANQCVAAAKLGSQTTLVARVGDDAWGKKYIQILEKYNVETKYVYETCQYSSGIAQIVVASSGANQIVIVAGANSKFSVEDVEKAREEIESADVLLCQLETPPETAIKAMELCKHISILNATPPPSVVCDPRLLTLPSIFCVNESEASYYAGFPVNSIKDAERAVLAILSKGCKCVIITLGENGAMFSTHQDHKVIKVASPSFNCVDTTGAGDCFIGALAYLLSTKKKLPLKQCIEAACYVASDSVTRRGTQISFPGSEILEQYFMQ